MSPPHLYAYIPRDPSLASLRFIISNGPREFPPHSPSRFLPTTAMSVRARNNLSASEMATSRPSYTNDDACASAEDERQDERRKKKKI